MQETRKATKTALISIDANKYSVPARLARKRNQGDRYIDLIGAPGGVIPTGVFDELDCKDGDLLDTLSQYYIESRYTEDRDTLARKCTRAFTENMLKETGVVFEWLKSQLM